jgi:hypothetical protein
MAKDPSHRFQSGLALCKAIASLDIITASNVTENFDSAPISLQAVPTNTRQPSITIDESSYRKLGLAKRYNFRCQLRSDDLQHFIVVFGQFTTRLVEWHQRHNKQCGAVTLQVTITESMLPRVLQLIEQLVVEDETGAFAFLQKIQFDILIKDFKQSILKRFEGKKKPGA